MPKANTGKGCCPHRVSGAAIQEFQNAHVLEQVATTKWIRHREKINRSGSRWHLSVYESGGVATNSCPNLLPIYGIEVLSTTSNENPIASGELRNANREMGVELPIVMAITKSICHDIGSNSHFCRAGSKL